MLLLGWYPAGRQQWWLWHCCPSTTEFSNGGVPTVCVDGTILPACTPKLDGIGKRWSVRITRSEGFVTYTRAVLACTLASANRLDIALHSTIPSLVRHSVQHFQSSPTPCTSYDQICTCFRCSQIAVRDCTHRYQDGRITAQVIGDELGQRELIRRNSRDCPTCAQIAMCCLRR